MKAGTDGKMRGVGWVKLKNYILPAVIMTLILTGLLTGCATSAGANGGGTGEQTAVQDVKIKWKDRSVEQMIREYLNKPSGTIYRSDLAGIESLHIIGTAIQRPGESGEEFAARLEEEEKARKKDFDL